MAEIDPVCGMTVDPAKAAGQVNHQGKTYFFCSKGCAARFEKEPAGFLAKPGVGVMSHGSHAAGLVSIQMPAAKPAPQQQTKGTRYTCPMHPEVVQIGPGTCPKCGMALEPMDIASEPEADPEYESMSRRFWVSAALSLPLLVVGMFSGRLGLPLSDGAL